MKINVKKFFVFWSVLTAGVAVLLAAELLDWGPHADASGGAAKTEATPPAPPPPPSHAELRERYRKRLEELAAAKAEDSKSTPSGPSEKDVQELHAQLKERTKKLDEREAEIQSKESALQDKQAFLQQQLGKYEATLGKLRQELKSLEAARDEKVTAFRAVYEKMEPKKAARILDDMDAELASKILSGMKQQQAAEILSKMEPEKARRITKRFLSSTGQASTQ